MNKTLFCVAVESEGSAVFPHLTSSLLRIVQFFPRLLQKSRVNEFVLRSTDALFIIPLWDSYYL